MDDWFDFYFNKQKYGTAINFSNGLLRFMLENPPHAKGEENVVRIAVTNRRIIDYCGVQPLKDWTDIFMYVGTNKYIGDFASINAVNYGPFTGEVGYNLTAADAREVLEYLHMYTDNNVTLTEELPIGEGFIISPASNNVSIEDGKIKIDIEDATSVDITYSYKIKADCANPDLTLELGDCTAVSNDKELNVTTSGAESATMTGHGASPTLSIVAPEYAGTGDSVELTITNGIPLKNVAFFRNDANIGGDNGTRQLTDVLPSEVVENALGDALSAYINYEYHGVCAGCDCEFSNSGRTEVRKTRVTLVYRDEEGNEIMDDVVRRALLESMDGFKDRDADIDMPELPWYEWQGNDISTLAGERLSGYIDDSQDRTLTFGVQDASTLAMQYRAIAEIKMLYADELGNNLFYLFDEEPPLSITGYRGETAEIPTPDLQWYDWQYYILSTAAGEEPSGYMENQYAATATFGHRDASHIKVVYRAKAQLPIEHIDTVGNNLAELNVTPANTVELLSGYRGEEFEFTVPTLPRYTLKGLALVEPDAEDFIPGITGFNTNVLNTGYFNVGNGSKVVVTDDPMPFSMERVNPEGIGLHGGSIEIHNAAGNKVWEGISDTNGEYHIPALGAGEYRVTEIAAPAGYYLSNVPWEFKVSVANEVTGTLRYINSPVIKTILNVDALTGSPIAGSVFGVFDANNVLLNQGTTGKDGKVSFRLQAHGKYTIKQISVPGEYFLAGETVTFDLTLSILCYLYVFERRRG